MKIQPTPITGTQTSDSMGRITVNVTDTNIIPVAVKTLRSDGYTFSVIDSSKLEDSGFIIIALLKLDGQGLSYVANKSITYSIYYAVV